MNEIQANFKDLAQKMSPLGKAKLVALVAIVCAMKSDKPFEIKFDVVKKALDVMGSSYKDNIFITHAELVAELLPRGPNNELTFRETSFKETLNRIGVFGSALVDASEEATSETKRELAILENLLEALQ